MQHVRLPGWPSTMHECLVRFRELSITHAERMRKIQSSKYTSKPRYTRQIDLTTRPLTRFRPTVLQVCVPITKINCLSPPCYAWGECRDLLSGNKVSLSTIPAPPTCQPNQAVLSDYCMRMSLYVDIAKLRPSVTTEDLCNEIRGLVSVHEATKSTQFEIVVLCDFRLGLNDTVEITLVSMAF